MDTVGIHVLTRQITKISTFRVSSALRHNSSGKCANAQMACRILDIFSESIISFDDTFSIWESVQIDYLF
jgi:hypothetical protein